MKQKYYSIGEVFRLGLLKNHEGQPYKHKATISKVVSSLKFRQRKTAWGPSKEVSMAEIERYNQSRAVEN